MSISLAIPAVTSANPASLNAIAGPLLTDHNAQSSALPVISPRSGVVSQVGSAANSATAANGLDALTPQSATPSEAAALSTIISTITTSLNSIQSSTGQSVNQAVSQLLQSQGFLLLFHVLGAAAVPGSTSSASGDTVTVQLGDLLTHVAEASAKTVSAVSNVPSVAGASAASATTPGAGSKDNSAPYFQKLLGELAGTFSAKTPAEAHSPVTATTGLPSTFSSSELDLFLKWLSLNGSGSVVASA